MDLYHTTDTDGVSELNPDAETMRELIARLDEPGSEDSEHPDVSLVHDPSGWSIALYPSGIVTLENLDDDDASPQYMSGVSREEAFKLWEALAHGKIEELKSGPWLRSEAY